ncbi:hypothetical protein [Nonomuraea dietziae]|uniref:hypothetical protein n=1 Tax=Nonomuraea dietziae TaxID=65515 RepID=UPI0031E2843D
MANARTATIATLSAASGGCSAALVMSQAAEAIRPRPVSSAAAPASTAHSRRRPMRRPDIGSVTSIPG